jgi:hypothetical protein
LFQFPEVAVLGVYDRDHLVSIGTSCLVGDVLVLKDGISSERALETFAVDLLLNYEREHAADRPDIRMIYAGYLTRNDGINRYKIERGAEVTTLPATLRMNRFSLWALRMMSKGTYGRLRGLDEAQVRAKYKQV